MGNVVYGTIEIPYSFFSETDEMDEILKLQHRLVNEDSIHNLLEKLKIVVNDVEIRIDQVFDEDES